MAKINLKNIEKTYPNGYNAVSNFNLEIKDKEFIVLVGPSGCGKSTILRMIAGLEEISSGELYIDEGLVNEVEPKDRDIAMVFQNYALYPHKTAYENIAFGLKMRKVPKDKIKAKVEDAAKTLGIIDLLDRKPKELSGGQKQRVALGRAIVREPKVFLMDEPLSNLDAKLRTHMRTEISKLHKKLQTTFIYVTHDQTEAMTMGSRIVVLKDGLVQQIADPQTIYSSPANVFVATFIGSPQINLIECKVIKKYNDIYIKFQENEILLPGAKAKMVEEKGYIDKTIIVGIRPEAISIKCNRNEKYNNIKGKVEVKEMLGSEAYLYLDIRGQELIVKTEANITANIGDYIDIVFDEEKIHMFDKKSEQIISY
ncbi:putative ABC transporter ATP-binding protein [Gottschalkia acidurici 9a]|uniref:ABC transporter ATP-binding protein n=1 Tax=Gottschalkia acidurici (strain ATCC 7906 / DSM 604 / BCRC 14475 / CIP 104303 / KCTC 5404 / NCIMB 10678 / 9a) TaxID=1128398 RepID=K0AYU3_GOTA9|nr:sn-glycerol-3-phosphate ABC transporter ATP-binding protein UgpC [Gottschalkia acidurici]AFS78953.1 putative ABC transporter ATP-binding protein [Gottschalkia acidurici 9a]